MTQPPRSLEAEQSVVGQLLKDPDRVGEIVATLLEPQHFYHRAWRHLYDEIVTAYYADDPIDPLSLAATCAPQLANDWGIDREKVAEKVQAHADHGWQGDPASHAGIVKRNADYRALLELSAATTAQVNDAMLSPEDIASSASQTAMQIATSSLLAQDLHSYEDLGRAFVQEQRRLMAARAQGVELGAYFGLPFLDNYVRGLRPGELFFLAGEPGSGKSAVAWKAAQLFAERQAKRPAANRISAFVASLEMGQESSNIRLAQSVTGLDGSKLREGRTTQEELRRVIDEWGQRKELPLYFNFASMLSAPQMRALIVDAIRKHNVGVVVIDHFRYFRMGREYRNRVEEDEDKVTFLSQQIAKDLNVAVICLAHTTKGIDSTEDRRPKLTHLRGSGQIAAEADFVAFVYRPYKHAKADEIDEGGVLRTDAELIYEKNRHNLEGSARFFFDPSTMTVK